MVRAAFRLTSSVTGTMTALRARTKVTAFAVSHYNIQAKTRATAFAVSHYNIQAKTRATAFAVSFEVIITYNCHNRNNFQQSSCQVATFDYSDL